MPPSRLSITLGAVIVLSAIVICVGTLSHRPSADKYLIYPYLDLDEVGERGQFYAMSEGACATSKDSFCSADTGDAASGNIQLYDAPFHYPNYEAKHLMRFDGDKTCVAYCSQSPCAVQCR